MGKKTLATDLLDIEKNLSSIKDIVSSFQKEKEIVEFEKKYPGILNFSASYAEDLIPDIKREIIFSYIKNPFVKDAVYNNKTILDSYEEFLAKEKNLLKEKGPASEKYKEDLGMVIPINNWELYSFDEPSESALRDIIKTLDKDIEKYGYKEASRVSPF